MGVRELIDQSPAELDREARELAEQGDSVFWDWLCRQREWPDLVERFAESRIREQYVRHA